MADKPTPPRPIPDRDSRYMALAWIHAGFSKDPSTQVGAVIVDPTSNTPLGSGYNGLPRQAYDANFDWSRPPESDPDAFSKYDMVIHAEMNAIAHSGDVTGATMYVVCLPCPNCMKHIALSGITRVVYMDYRSHTKSMLQSEKWQAKTEKIASLNRVKLEKFGGNINWLPDWVEKLKEAKVFEI